MDSLDLNIIVSIILLSVNLYCSFWIFREALNLAGVTFRESLHYFANRPLTGIGRSRLRKKQRRIFHYLAERTDNPEKLRKLLRWYGISTLPGLAALILAEFAAILPIANKEKYVFIGNMILVLLNIALVIIGKVYRQNHPLEERMAEKLAIKREREKGGKHRIVYTIVGGIFLSFLIGFHLAAADIFNSQSSSTQLPAVTEKLHFSDVHTALSTRGFETANIPTTYWFYDEDKLTNVVSGIKGTTGFEFYEYSDGETTDRVYHRISYDIAQDMEPAQRAEYETELSKGGKMFTATQNGVYYIVLYQNNTVVYAYSSEDTNEIQEILVELGYCDGETSYNKE